MTTQMRRRPKLKPNEKLLPPTRANAGIAASYRRALDDLIREMHISVQHWITAAWRSNEPVLARDAAPKKRGKSVDQILKEISTAASRDLHGTGKGILPSGVELIATIEVAGGKKRTVYRVRESGKPYARTLSAENLRIMLDQERAAIAPTTTLQDAMAGLAKRWQDRFDEAAPRLAEYFSTAVEDRSSSALKRILKEGGFTVRLKMTPAQKDVLDATIHANVALIKSIPAKYLTEVEGHVMRSVQQGRDLKTLTDALEKEYGITRRRAAFIARDQNNKAQAAMTAARQQEFGITEAIWRHSHAGKVPRPTHVAADGKRYDIRKGMYDSAVKRYVFPGTEPNCRCFSQSIIPGFV